MTNRDLFSRVLCALICSSMLGSTFASAAPADFLNTRPGKIGFDRIPKPQGFPNQAPFSNNLRDATEGRDMLFVGSTEYQLQVLFGLNGSNSSVDRQKVLKMVEHWRKELARERTKPELPDDTIYAIRYRNDDRIDILEDILIPEGEQLAQNPANLQLAQKLIEIHQQTRTELEAVKNSSSSRGYMLSNAVWDNKPSWNVPAKNSMAAPMRADENPSDSGFFTNRQVESFDVSQPLDKVSKFIVPDLIPCDTARYPGCVPGALLLDPSKWKLGKKKKKINGKSEGYLVAAVKVKKDAQGRPALDAGSNGRPKHKTMIKMKLDLGEVIGEGITARLTAALGYNTDISIPALGGLCVDEGDLSQVRIKCWSDPGLIKPDMKGFSSLGMWNNGFLMDHHQRREVRATRILYSFFQNWDIKDAQLKMHYHEDSKQLAMSLNDLGASLGNYKVVDFFDNRLGPAYTKGSVCAIRAQEAIATSTAGTPLLGLGQRPWEYSDEWYMSMHTLFVDPDAHRFLTREDAEWIVKRISRLTKEQYRAAAKAVDIERVGTRLLGYSAGVEAEFVHRMLCRRDAFAKALGIALPAGASPEPGCAANTPWTNRNCAR